MSGRTMPVIYVTVKDLYGNSERITEQTHRVKSLQYTDSEAKADKAVLVVDNYDLSNFDDPVWAHRNILQLTWGYPENMALTRELVITKVTGFTELKIEARAKSVLMDTVKKSKTYENKTRSEVVREIAEANGYTPSNYFIEETTKRFPHITQARLSDAQFLRKLAHQQGFEFYCDYTGLHWHERKLLQTPLRTFTYFTDRSGDILNIAIEQDITRRPAEVSRVVHDPVTKTDTTVKADDTSDKEREGTAQVLLVKAPDLKTAGLAAAYVPEDTAPAASAGDTEVAKVKYRRAQRSAVKLNLEAIGDASMLAKSVIVLSGVGQRLTGNYYVKEVVHNIAPGNYRMQLKCISDGTGPVGKPRRGYVEPGLPEVTPTKSNAKTPSPAEAAQAAANADVTPATAHNPEALVPVEMKDAAGNVIGTSWRAKGPATVTLSNGKLSESGG